MGHSVEAEGVAPARPARSERLDLAQLASITALSVPGVVRTDRGTAGLFITADGGEQVDGVICTAAQSGGYDVTLALVCALTPLRELAETVRQRVIASAGRSGLAAHSVSVHITEVAEAADAGEGER